MTSNYDYDAVQQNEEEIILEETKEVNTDNKIKLDYTLEDPKDRIALVQKIIDNTDPDLLTSSYLDRLSDYIIFAMDKQERKNKKILTDNRMVTVNKRETSYEGLCGKFENGEDGIYNLISDLGKNMILIPKDPITEKDLEVIPGLKELREDIQKVEELYKNAVGKKKYLLKKQIIEMRQDQYILRTATRNAYGGKTNSTVKSMSKMDFYDDITFDKDGNPVNNGIISFFNPEHIEALLCNYSELKEESEGVFNNDLYYMMLDLDELIEKTLKEDYPLYYDLLVYKIDKKTNLEIQKLLEETYNIKHSIEYISSLWRNKIPKLLADQAEKDYLVWYYTTQEYGHWKKCSKCGEIKLAHNKFFSRNSSSKDGWYSLCKQCRNSKSKKNQK